jgi:hypothetical protein
VKNERSDRMLRNFDLVNDYLFALTQGERRDAEAARDAIGDWLHNAPCDDDATLRLVGLVMMLARRCATEHPYRGWRIRLVTHSRPLERETPPDRLAVRLVLAYAEAGEGLAVDLMTAFLTALTLPSLPGELARTFHRLTEIFISARADQA